MNTATLAMRAQQSEAKAAPKPQRKPATLKPVKTVFDGQEESHQREEQELIATGTDSGRESLGFDFSDMNRNQRRRAREKLFSEPLGIDLSLVRRNKARQREEKLFGHG